MFSASSVRHLLRGGLLLLAALVAATGSLALSDPTRPPSRSSVARSPGPPTAWTKGLELTSILVAPERRVAVINGQPLQVGERIGGLTVVEIRVDEVRLKHDNRKLTLTLNRGVVKKPAKGQ